MRAGEECDIEESSWEATARKTSYTVVPVMNGHPRDQAKVSVHDRWPLIGGTVRWRQT